MATESTPSTENCIQLLQNSTEMMVLSSDNGGQHSCVLFVMGLMAPRKGVSSSISTWLVPPWLTHLTVGIFGDKEKGTYSIVLSGGGYHDVDNGESIEYSGTDGKNFTATEATSQMITSAKLGNPIRVIRSAQLHKGNEYRPERGLRYDGLYVIKSYKEVDKAAQKYRFSLERCPGQAPIRCGDGNSRRPTIFEMHEYDKLKGRV
jgi:hypothetical protein